MNIPQRPAPFAYQAVKAETGGFLLFGTPPDQPEALLSLVSLSPIELEKLQQMRAPKRRSEWIFARYLLQQHLPHASLHYDTAGKPALSSPTVQISITHTHGLVALLFSSARFVGIDAEAPSPKLAHVAHKFVSEHETPLLDTSNLAHLCLLWAAKEAAFKVHGFGGLDFRTQLLLRSTLHGVPASFSLELLLPHASHLFTVHHKQLGKHFLVWIEQD